MRSTATTALNARHITASLLGAAAALLAARLVLRLVAARPDNPVFNVFFTLTTPLPPLALLDRGQPRFGAVLEFSTLVLLLILVAVGLIVARTGRRRADNG